MKQTICQFCDFNILNEVQIDWKYEKNVDNAP
jgi:hypothetical protein